MINLFAKKMIKRSTNKLLHINSWKTYMLAYIGFISAMVDINHFCKKKSEYIRNMF